MTGRSDPSAAPDEELVALFLEAGSGDVQARDRLDARLQARPQDRRHLAELERMWSDIGALPAPSLRCRSNEKAPSFLRRFRVPLALAAGIAALIMTPFFLSSLPAGNEIAQGEQFMARKGSRTITLADGSTMVLAPGSAARVRLEAQRRSVSLERGEAYFKVAHDADRPFLVSTDAGQARAVGTAFSVRRGDADGIVTVSEGIVEVSTTDHALKQRVSAGQQVSFDVRRISTPRAIDALSAVSWTQGTLRFDGAPLGEVLSVFNRYSTRKITLRDGRLAGMPVFAIIRTDDVDGIVTIIRSQAHLNADAFARAVDVAQTD